MKKLYIVRHAKSPWNQGENDYDRGLVNGDENSTTFMADQLVLKGAKIDYVLSSSANRTTKTTLLINQVLGVNESKIEFHKELYLASPTTILSHIHSVPNTVNELMVVAHNPGVTQLVNYLANENFGDIPPTGMACVTFDITSWNEIKNNGNLGFFIYPNMFKQL